MSTTVTVLVLLFTSAAGDSVDQIQKDYWAWRMQNEPEYSTYLGIYAYNDRVMSYNLSQFEYRKNKTSEFLQRLNTVDSAAMDSASKVNYQILKDTLETYIDGYEFAWLAVISYRPSSFVVLYGALNPMNFLEGLQLYYSATMALTRTRGDYENYIVRLHGVVKQLAEIKDTFREAIQLNRTYNNVSVAGVPGQIDKLLVNDTELSSFYSPFNDSLSHANNIPELDKADIRMRGKQAIEAMLEGYRDMKNFITQEYMPNTRKSWGVSSLDNGGAYYQACLKWHLSHEMSPTEVHERGLQEVARIYGEMTKAIERLGFEGTVKEFFASLVDDPRFYTNDSDLIIEEYKEIVFERINPVLPRFFKDIPDVPLEIRKMTFDGPGGGYSSASETSPGIFSVNLIRPMENPRFDFMALSLHEANPGHHLQHIYAMKTSLPDFRRYTPISFYDVPFWFPFYSAYSEGWALYSEYLGEEMGLYKDDYELMGRYSAEMLRACRLVVDTGLHYFNWQKERAIEYMLNYTAYSREATETEVNRYITWPGQACAYKLGEIKIRDLRRKAENELGERFDIKDFHSVVLVNGAMPISVLESVVQEWIEASKNTPLPSSNAHTLRSLPCVILMSYLIVSIV